MRDRDPRSRSALLLAAPPTLCRWHDLRVIIPLNFFRSEVCDLSTRQELQTPVPVFAGGVGLLLAVSSRCYSAIDVSNPVSTLLIACDLPFSR